MQNDKKLRISVAQNRKSLKWFTEELNWSDFITKISKPIRTTETYEQFIRMKKSQQDELKDVGGFVAGELKDGRRKAENVLNRCLISLDADHIASGQTNKILGLLSGLGCAYAVYSTRKHCSDKPRLRIIIPTDRILKPDEYEPIARKIASFVGMEILDSSTFEASRLMYWPSCSKDSEFVFKYEDKPFASADGILGMYKDWKDIIEWLKENPPTRINVTLYGGSNESYSRLCGDPRGFDKVRRGVRLLAENGIRFQFNCSLTPDNADELERMSAFAGEYGMGLRLATYMFPPVRRTGQTGDYDARFTPEEAAYYQVLNDWMQLPPERFAVLARNARHFTELTPEILAEAAAKPPRGMGCLSGRCSYWVDWQGNLSGCGMMDIPKISLADHSLEEAWKEVVDWTEQLRYSPVCANCVNRSVCFSCAAMVHNETGSFDGRPVYLCEKAKYAAKYYKEFMEKLPEDILSAVPETAAVRQEEQERFEMDDDGI